MGILLRIRNGMSNATEGDVRGNINDLLIQGGIIDADHLLVAEADTPAMEVKVSPGVFYVLNNSWSEFSSEIKFWDGLLDAEDTVSIASNPSGSTRIDLVAVKVDTTVVSDANASNVASIVVVEGTPGAGAPSLPANHLELAQVSVASGATSITNANITDTRTYIKMSLVAPTITNLTLTSPVINTGVSGTAVLDEDNMASNSNTKVATQQSIKAYVDNSIGDIVRTLIVDAINAPVSLTVGDGKIYIPIPAELNGMNLIGVYFAVITAGTTGTTDFQIHNVTDAVDMLSTKATIDSGETSTATAATPAVIDTTKDDVATNDLLRIDIDAISTTAPKGLVFYLRFALP